MCYLKIFRENDVGKGRLLAWEEETQLITWQISFNHLQQTRGSAADLLSAMSFFDRQGIPVNLLESERTTKVNQSDEMEGNSGRSHGNEKTPPKPGIEGLMDDIMILEQFHNGFMAMFSSGLQCCPAIIFNSIGIHIKSLSRRGFAFGLYPWQTAACIGLCTTRTGFFPPELESHPIYS
jgi:hypothetical protein